MENKYLNLTGAVYIISKIKTLLGDKSDKGHTHSKEEIGLGNVENKSSQTIRGELTSDWKEIGTFRDVNEHVISNIKSYRELRVNFMLYYSGSSYITRDYVFPVSESNNLEFLFLDGNYYDNNNYSSWCIVYNTIKNSIQNRSSWLRNVILGKDTTCQCVYRVYGR